jgi:hypothetical protein
MGNLGNGSSDIVNTTFNIGNTNQGKTIGSVNLPEANISVDSITFNNNSTIKGIDNKTILVSNNGLLETNPVLNSITYDSKFELNTSTATNNPQLTLDSFGSMGINGSLSLGDGLIQFYSSDFTIQSDSTTLLTLNNSGDLTITGWLYQSRNRVYQQNLTASTTTSTTMVALGSANSITPKFSGHIVISAELRINNDTVGDGVEVELLNGTTILDSETYTQEGLASNSHTLIFHYELTGQTIGTALSISLNYSAVTGGTASAKIVSFICEEI